MKQSLKEYFMLRESNWRQWSSTIESDALIAKGKLILCLKSIEIDSGGQIKARLGCYGKRVV